MLTGRVIAALALAAVSAASFSAISPTGRRSTMCARDSTAGLDAYLCKSWKINFIDVCKDTKIHLGKKKKRKKGEKRGHGKNSETILHV